MKELSIFVDESGNFGPYDSQSSFYIFSLVYHDQTKSINKMVDFLNRELDLIKYGSRYFHAGPIIRKENEYKNLNISVRRKIFNKMSFFANHIEYHYTSVMVDKKHIKDELELFKELSKQLGRVILNNLSYFQSFNNIKIYYDNGQKQLSRLLVSVLGALLNEPTFKIVKPQDYHLFQVADLISTLELTNHKYKTKSITNSEKYFFGNYRYFYRTYYKFILKKKL